MAEHNSKIRCQGCGNWKSSKSVIQFRGKLLCGTCRQKKPNSRLQMSAGQRLNPTRKLSLEEALSKTFYIKGYKGKNGRILTNLCPPQVLIGHKIKFILADNE